MKVETKNHIIKVASDLFYRNGYNLTGINEIIKEANIAKATLYNHFKSKDEICLAYLGSRHSNFMLDLDHFVNNSKKRKNRIVLIFEFLKAFYNSKGFNGCWCLKTYAEIPKNKLAINQVIKKQKLELIEFIAKILREDFAFKSEKVINEKSKQIYLIYEGAVGESHLHEEEWPINAAMDLCKLILK
jgi:AcrR family transcriptional regulator